MRIVSGGQTGVDRAALDAAIASGIAHGGFCPRGRRAEDGVIPPSYGLTEISTEAYPARTAMNVRQAHGTLLLVHGRAGLLHSAGTKLTLDICRREGKPWHAADPRRPHHAPRVAGWIENLALSLEKVPGWLEELEPEPGALVVNVAGPRESRCPGIHDETVEFLRMVFEQLS